MNDLMIMLNARSLNLEMDSWEWKWNKDKKFSVKSFYNVLLRSHKEYVAPIESFPHKLVWKAKIPLNVKFFFWSLIRGRTLTKDILFDRNISGDNLCVLCNDNKVETSLHLFLDCSVSAQVWQALIGHLTRAGLILAAVSVKMFLTNWPSLHSRGFGEIIWDILPFAALWVIWNHRNSLIFKHEPVEVNRMVQQIKSTVWGMAGCRVELQKQEEGAQVL
ncbi:hypothetical protein FRX31_005730 [Thalictrum thalictroides]|uniref:Reverse transcriptase zinc-binding domain-containing protein n=1 Tax=Thalictrum thalictroides TaxID=46969 RepID=A0A7J6X4S2_THATH|nr:hypothetical protein FRX31_005730 [Thalictrum thalictroides]